MLQDSPEDTTPQGNSDWISTYDLDPKLLEQFIDCDIDDCTDEADFWIKTSCCNNVRLNCAVHMEKAIRYVITLSRRKMIVKCQYCSDMVAPMEYFSRPEKIKLVLDKPDGI